MLRHPNGRVRYFSVRESACLQTFPDGYELRGAWGEAMRQLGNAAPVLLAAKVAGSVAVALEEASLRREFLDRSWRDIDVCWPETDIVKVPTRARQAQESG